MSWTFTPYEKISESSTQWDHKSAPKLFKKASAVRGQHADITSKWVVTEKVHGANFCILSDGIDSTCAKRTQILDPNDEFFGYKGVHEKYKENVLQAFHFNNQYTLHVFGELFGGGYPHSDYPLDEQKLVQTGIYYCHQLEFYAFDIATVSKGSMVKEYLDYDKALEVFEKCKFFYAKPLLIGSFEEVSNFKVGFQSTIPERLGMPPLLFPNIAEGVVVKAMRSTMLAAQKGNVRASLKIKDKSFKEEKPLPAEELKGDLKSRVMILAEGLVTENRKNNAISKIGRVKTNDQKELLEKMLIEDVLETLQEKGGEKEKEKGKEKDNGGRKQTLWEKLSAREKQEAKEHVQSLVRTFLTKKK